MTIDTRTPAEIAYDSLKDGSIYAKSTAPTYEERFAAGFRDGQAIAAALTTTDPRVTITPGGDDEDASWMEYKAGDVEIVRDLKGHFDPANPFTLYIHGQLVEGVPITLTMLQGLMCDLGYLLSNDRVLAAFDAPQIDQPAIEIRRLYNNLAEGGDVCFDASAGPLAYTDFILGAEDDDLRAEISLQADGTEPDIFLFGNDGVPLSQVMGALGNLSRLLADERVRAEAGAPMSDAEARAIHILYPDVVITPSRDAAHREERWLSILETIAAMDEPAKSEALGYCQGVLDAVMGK